MRAEARDEVPVFRSGALLHQDARAIAGCREHHDARHYLDLLAGAGLIVGLPKFAGQMVRQRGSSPKLQVLNTALLTAPSGLAFEEARADLLGQIGGVCRGRAPRQ